MNSTHTMFFWNSLRYDNNLTWNSFFFSISRTEIQVWLSLWTTSAQDVLSVPFHINLSGIFTVKGNTFWLLFGHTLLHTWDPNDSLSLTWAPTDPQDFANACYTRPWTLQRRVILIDTAAKTGVKLMESPKETENRVPSSRRWLVLKSWTLSLPFLTNTMYSVIRVSDRCHCNTWHTKTARWRSPSTVTRYVYI